MGIYQSRHRETYFVIVFMPTLLAVIAVADTSDYTISFDLNHLILCDVMTIK